MPIDILSTFQRKNGGDFPLLENTDVGGGWMTVADNTARDAIKSAIRAEGMHVWSVGAATLYELAADLVTWTPVPFGAAASSTFVFRPGGVAGGNIYTSWTTLMTALSASSGVRYLQFDSSIAGTCTIPAGGPYPMQDVRWIAPSGVTAAVNKITNVDIADGASFTNLRWIDGDFSIRNLNTASPADDTLAAGDIVRILGGATVSNNGAAPLWRGTALNTFFAVAFVEFATIIGSIGTVFDLPTSGGVLVVQLGFGSTWRGSALSGVAGTTMSIAKRSSSASFATSYAAFAGTISTTSAAWDTTPTWRLDPFLLAPRTTPIGSPGDGEIMRFNASGGAIAQSLPSINGRAATALDAGGCIIAVETSGTAGLTVSPAAGDTINGVAAAFAVPAGGAVLLIQDGVSNWHIVGVYSPAGLAATAVLIFGNNAIAASADTRFISPGFTNQTAPLVSNAGWRAPRAGTLRRFRVRHNTAVGNGSPVVYDVRKNGAAQGLGLSLATGAIGDASNLVTNISVAAGDLIEVTATKAVSIGAGDIDLVLAMEFA